MNVNEYGKQPGKASEPIEHYVQDVLDQLPPAVPGLHRMSADLTAHLREAADASGSDDGAVREMGPAKETARGYAEGLDLDPASLVDRTGAFLLDAGLGVAVAALIFVLEEPLLANVEVSTGLILAATTGGLLSVLYFPVLEALFGQTLGKRFFGLCVAREDGLRVGWWAAVIRRLPLFFEIFWLDALFAPFTEKKQRAFDIVASTIVAPGIARGGRPAGWTLAAALWTLPAAVILLAGG